MLYDPDLITPYKYQNFEQIRKELITSKKLFEDPLFLATNESIYKNQPVPAGTKWMRPKDVVANPQFVVDSFDRTDMDQGSIGNCWFIAAVAGLVQNAKLFAKVVPKDQSFTKDYAGIFHFRFWLYGRWVDVVIDDRLPYDSRGRLIFSSNSDSPNEFWCSLLEKAYAKFYGCYEKLISGHIYNGFIDMSGGIQEKIELKSLTGKQKQQLWSLLLKAIKKNALMGCSMDAQSEIKMNNGLVKGHAYTITKVVELKSPKVHKLVRIRNPWGNSKEWNGAWSDSSSEWSSLTVKDKNSIEYVAKKDGEFWMSFEDFITNWDSVGICHLTPDSLTEELVELDDDSDLEWSCKMFVGQWKKACSAGGCTGEKYWINPQYLVTLKDVDDNDGEKKATVVLCLMQKDSKDKKNMHYIAINIYKLKDGVDLKGKEEKLSLSSNVLTKAGSTGSYINSREVSVRLRLDPGRYVVIPSTYSEHEESDYLLRIFTEKKIKK